MDQNRKDTHKYSHQSQHLFLVKPGNWVGEGCITFSTSPEKLNFLTNWNIQKEEEGEIICQQSVKLQHLDEPNHNHFILSQIHFDRFEIKIKNENIGEVVGKGIIDEKSIAWEFNGPLSFQGFEVYEKQSDGHYKFHAEYASQDDFRTVIEGVIRLE